MPFDSEAKKRPYSPGHDAGIYIASNKLDDGSETYDVVLSYFGDVRLPAVTLKDADALALALKDVIEKHTTVEVTYDDPERFGVY
jgi:hypothetical protein